MYLSRPPISPKAPGQLSDTPSVKLHRGKGNVTTVMVRDPDQIKHPVTRKFQSRWQNDQTASDYSGDETVEATETGMFTKGNRKAP